MTIDELFSMPLSKMREWMMDHYHDPRGHYNGSYWFCDIYECFDLDKDPNSNWRVVPVMSSYSYNGGYGNGGWVTALDAIKRSYSDTLQFGVAKISKYGESLVYVFEGTLEEVTYKNYKYILNSVVYNDNGNSKSRVYLDGKDVVNGSKLCVEFESSEDHTDKFLNKYEFLDKYPFLEFSGKPVVNSLSKNKHPLNEFAGKLEKYAERVSTVTSKVYEANKNIVNDSSFVERCKKIQVKPKDVFIIWLSLFTENENVTLEDTINIIRLAQSKEQLFVDYVNSCKCKTLGKGWKGEWEIHPYNYYHCYHICPLYGRTNNPEMEHFVGLVKKLDATRDIYKQLDSYKDIIKLAAKEYKEGYTEIAKNFEAEISGILARISKDLEHARAKYLKDSKTLYDGIHAKYEGVNDTDIKAIKDNPDIVKPIEEAFEGTSVKLMRCVDKSYKPVRKTEAEDEELVFSEEFKAICKEMFDASPELDKLPYFAAGKAYDAPYELYDREVEIDEDAFYDYDEKHGQGASDRWFDEFMRLAPAVDDWKDYCDDLYPGETRVWAITRDLLPDEYEED